MPMPRKPDPELYCETCVNQLRRNKGESIPQFSRRRFCSLECWKRSFPPADAPERFCSGCERMRAAEEFNFDRTKRGGRTTRCRDCRRPVSRAYHQARMLDPASRVRRAEAVKEWRQQNPDKWRKQYTAYRQGRGIKARASDLRRFYGMTVDDYMALVVAQDGKCAICDAPPKAGKILHVDHDHSTGVVRGLLCGSCNSGLGYFRDDIERLLLAVAYLETSRCPAFKLA